MMPHTEFMEKVHKDRKLTKASNLHLSNKSKRINLKLDLSQLFGMSLDDKAKLHIGCNPCMERKIKSRALST